MPIQFNYVIFLYYMNMYCMYLSVYHDNLFITYYYTEPTSTGLKKNVVRTQYRIIHIHDILYICWSACVLTSRPSVFWLHTPTLTFSRTKTLQNANSLSNLHHKNWSVTNTLDKLIRYKYYKYAFLSLSFFFATITFKHFILS